MEFAKILTPKWMVLEGNLKVTYRSWSFRDAFRRLVRIALSIKIFVLQFYIISSIIKVTSSTSSSKYPRHLGVISMKHFIVFLKSVCSRRLSNLT